MSNCELPKSTYSRLLPSIRYAHLLKAKAFMCPTFLVLESSQLTNCTVQLTSASSTQHQPQLNSRIGDKDHRRKGKWTLNCFLFCFVFNQIFIGTNWSMGQAFLWPKNVFFYAMNDHRWWRGAHLNVLQYII